MSTRPPAARRALCWTLAVGLSLAALVGPGAAQGDDLRTASAPSKPLDPRRLRALFLDVVGRPPTLAERERWQDERVDAFLDAVVGGEAFWENWLEEQLYYFLLVDNFRPTSARVLGAPAQLAADRIGVRDALHSIVLSASFDRRNPGPDTFVTVVLEQLLGMTVQKRPRELEIGKRIYDGAEGTFLGRRGDSQADVVRISIEERDALAHYLAREHRRLLRAEPDSRALSKWVRRLDQDDRAYAAILREWLASEAYERRLESFEPLPNRAFVNALFVDLTDAIADADEARRLRNALDGLADAGPLRSVLARLLIDSGKARIPTREDIEDPTRWVAGMFERYLGRAASDEELAVFVGAYHDPACRPETVVYAIVSHPEYQTW